MASDQALADSRGQMKLQAAIQEILRLDRENGFANTLSGEDGFWQTYTGSRRLPYDEFPEYRAKIEGRAASLISTTEILDDEAVQRLLNNQEGRRTLETLDVIDSLNPLFLKNREHLTAEERELTENYASYRQGRKNRIRANCNFNEFR